MPKKMEKGLKKSAKKKGLKGKSAARYVYGGMVNRGWTPGGKKRGAPKGNQNAKGRRR